MSDTFKVRITASEDFGVVEFDVPAANPQEAVAKLQSQDFAQAAEEAVHQQVLLAKSLKAAHGLSVDAAPVAHPSQQSAPQAQPPAWAQPQQQNQKVCGLCSAPLNYSTTKRGGMFKCPNYKGVKAPDGSWSKNGNGHSMEFTD